MVKAERTKLFDGVSTVYHSAEYTYINIKHVVDGLKSETKIEYDATSPVQLTINGGQVNVQWFDA